MANYLTHTLDPSAGFYVDYMTQDGALTAPVLKMLLAQQKEKLETLLTTKNMTLEQLMKAIAIRLI